MEKFVNPIYWPAHDEDQEAPEPDENVPELVTWECKKGHSWQTYGEATGILIYHVEPPNIGGNFTIGFEIQH